MTATVRQHLIDPAVCIRCNTCEATCPTGAVTHDDNNYVVDAATCNFCMACVSPCPTGSINHFVAVAAPFSLEDQFSWTELPEQCAILFIAKPPRVRSSYSPAIWNSSD
jgi:benzoyl-CoA 2,3-dioxygenase component A